MRPARGAAPAGGHFEFPAPDLDPGHDPGHAVAGARARAAGPGPVPPLHPAGPDGGTVRVGTASWTDPTLLAPGVFYPETARTPEARLRHYASRFPLVEVDASYYALPTRTNAERWVERTPAGFVFDVKAHALMTGQPSEVVRLPADLKRALPKELAHAHRLYGHQLPAELYDEVWRRFVDALEPLRAAGRLGGVLLQYPRWFTPTRANVDLLLDGQRRLGDIPGPVELRHHRWFGDHQRRTERTLAFFAEHDVPYVMVDGPQGLESSVPPAAGVTSPRLAVVRLHGRRAAAWEAPGIPTVERYRYLYDRDELAAWLLPITTAARAAREVHVLLNNCHGNYGTTNAVEIGRMLEGARARGR